MNAGCHTLYHSGVGWGQWGRLCTHRGKGTWEPSVLSAQFFCAPNTALQNRFRFKRSSPSLLLMDPLHICYTRTRQTPRPGPKRQPQDVNFFLLREESSLLSLHVSRASHVPTETLCLNYLLFCFHFRVLQGPLKPLAFPHSTLWFPPLNADDQPCLRGIAF